MRARYEYGERVGKEKEAEAEKGEGEYFVWRLLRRTAGSSIYICTNIQTHSFDLKTKMDLQKVLSAVWRIHESKSRVAAKTPQRCIQAMECTSGSQCPSALAAIYAMRFLDISEEPGSMVGRACSV